jgi:hypothetical protein
MNSTALKIALGAAAAWYLFRSQIAAMFSTAPPATAPAAAGTQAPATQTPAVSTSTAKSAALKASAGNAARLSFDQWAWYWQNAAQLGTISPEQMERIIAAGGGDRSALITAEQFAAYGSSSGLAGLPSAAGRAWRRT